MAFCYTESLEGSSEMSIMTVTSRVTHRSLMNKTKSELASLYLELCDVNGKLEKRVDELTFKSAGSDFDARFELLQLRAAIAGFLPKRRGWVANGFWHGITTALNIIDGALRAKENPDLDKKE